MLKAFLFCFFGLATDYFPAFGLYCDLDLGDMNLGQGYDTTFGLWQ